jgi:glutathione peroxidase
MSIYDYKVTAIDGKPTTLEPFKNQVLLIVNVASQCGFTPQYKELQEVYTKFKDKGFAVLGFPSNQFGQQEPGDEKEIKQFCELNYNVTFPLFSKIDVNGKDAHPLYEYLKNEKKGLLGSTSIKWNFTKFLVDRKGNVIERFASQTKPSELESKIKELL